MYRELEICNYLPNNYKTQNYQEGSMIKATAYAGAFVAAALQLVSTPAQADTITDYEVITAPAMQASKAPRTVLTEITTAGEHTLAVGDYGVIIYRQSNQDEWSQA